eukprot:6214687-Pleurochrysis_carterae.AAC.8
MDARSQRCHRQCHRTLPVMPCLLSGLLPKAADSPYRPKRRKISDPTHNVSYLLSVAQMGLLSHLNSSRSGGSFAPLEDCGRVLLHTSERRSAQRGSNQLKSSRGGGSQGDSPTTRRPGRGLPPLALASCECAPKAGVRGVSQGGRHSHCQLPHERSEVVNSRRVAQFDAQAFREGP